MLKYKSENAKLTELQRLKNTITQYMKMPERTEIIQ